MARGRPRKQKNFHAVRSTKGERRDFSDFFPVVFQNPYNGNDYDILEDLWTHTVAGAALDVRTRFAIGEGVKPVFDLKDKSIKDEKQKAELLKEYDEPLQELIDFDNKRTIALNDKVDDLFRNAKSFGRSMFGFESEGGDLPRALKEIHSRDMGRIFVRNLDFSLSSVRVFLRPDLVRAEEMVYLVNMRNSPRRRSMWYGYSEMQRIAGPAMALRQILEFDVREIAESAWAKYPMIRIDNEGLTQAEKEADMDTIKAGFKPAAFNFINAKKDEIEVFPFDLDPKVADIGTLLDKLERIVIGNFLVPAALLGREEDQNRATLLGKIRMFLAGPVEQDRRWLGQTLKRQWYERNLRLMSPGTLDHVEVNVEYEPIIIESWIDVIDSIQKLKLIFPGIPDDELLKLARLEQLIGKIDTSMQLTLEQLQEMKQKTNNDELASMISTKISDKR